MLYFPLPYPDELLCSLVYRYAVRKCESSYTQLMNELFGAYNTLLNYDLPLKIDHMAKKIYEVSGLTSEMLIYNNTMFPYFTTFVSIEKSNEIFQIMKSNFPYESVRPKAGIATSSIKDAIFFKFCPECNKEDMQKYGEMYWHRIHQTAGVLVCPVHEEYLQDSTARIFSGVSRKIQHASKHNCIFRPIVTRHSSTDFEKLIKISKTIKWLYDNYDINRGKYSQSNILHLKYREFINDKFAFADKNRILSVILEGFKAFYGENILRVVTNNRTYIDKFYWFRSLLAGSNIVHPIRHILFINYLTGDIEKFLFTNPIRTVFGNGPWECYNKICSNYLKPTINEVDINKQRSDKSIKIVGKFTCNSCGYEYSRIVDEAGNVTEPKLEKTGVLFDSYIKSIIDQGVRINDKLAVELGVKFDVLVSSIWRVNGGIDGTIRCNRAFSKQAWTIVRGEMLN